MELQLPQNTDYDEAARYLGERKTEDKNTRALLYRAEQALRSVCIPRGLWRLLPLTALPMDEAGNDLVGHLAGCDSMVLMAVTLGSGADKTLRQLCLSDIAVGAAADALASAWMDDLCEQMENTIRMQIQPMGKFCTGRYSPGYGDCPLSMQQEVCAVLDTVRGIGVAVTPENLLTPRKSVTAILGVADHPVSGKLAGCGHCLLRDKCEYRKRGTTCAQK